MNYEILSNSTNSSLENLSSIEDYSPKDSLNSMEYGLSTDSASSFLDLSDFQNVSHNEMSSFSSEPFDIIDLIPRDDTDSENEAPKSKTVSAKSIPMDYSSSEMKMSYYEPQEIKKCGMRLKEIKDTKTGKVNDVILLMDFDFAGMSSISPRFNVDINESFDETDEVVISGMSGRFPDAENVKEFSEHLYNIKKFTTTRNDVWDYTFEDRKQFKGQLKDCDTFDSKYFDIDRNRARQFNNELRYLVECVVEAVVDAGFNLENFYGSETGVFIGCNANVEFGTFISGSDPQHTYDTIGCLATSYAHHIQDIFQLTGPAAAFDTDVNSSLHALDHATLAVLELGCDNAIVASVHTNREPNNPLIFGAKKSEHLEGKRPIFIDTKYYRSEAVGVLFLQRKEDAKRVYATVCTVGCPSENNQETSLYLHETETYSEVSHSIYFSGISKSFKVNYKDLNIKKSELSYVETSEYGGHDLAQIEVDAMYEGLAKDRTKENPLLMGSVVSNIGHAGPATGMLAIIKILIAMENNSIPPTAPFMFNNANSALYIPKGMKIITEKTPFHGSYASITSINFQNYVLHTVLKKNEVEKSDKNDDFLYPKLLISQGRVSETLDGFFEEAKKHRDNKHFFNLLLQQNNLDCEKYPHRGYLVYDSQNSATDISRRDKWDKVVPQDMAFLLIVDNTDYIEIAKKMIKVPLFDMYMRQITKHLKRMHNIDIYKLLVSDKKNQIISNKKKLVMTCSVLMALLDLINKVGVSPNFFLGYSISEILCAYASSVITKEQALDSIVAYSSLNFDNFKDQEYRIVLIKALEEDMVEEFLGTVDVSIKIANNSYFVVGKANYIDDFYKMYSHLFEMKMTTNPFSDILAQKNIKMSIWSASITGQFIISGKKARYDDGEIDLRFPPQSMILKDFYREFNRENLVVVLGTSDNMFKEVLEKNLPDVCKIHQVFEEPDKNFVECFLRLLGEIYLNGYDLLIHKLYPKISHPAPRGTPMISPHWKWSKDTLWSEIDRDANNELKGDKLYRKLFRRNVDPSINVHLKPCGNTKCQCVCTKLPLTPPVFNDRYEPNTRRFTEVIKDGYFS